MNDFFFQNRNWQVNLQAAPRYRMKIDDIGNLEVRNATGERVPLRTLINVRYDSGPAIVNHYNLVSVGRDQRRHGAGRQLRPGHRDHGQSRRDVAAGHDGLRMDGADAISRSWPSKDLLTKLAFPLAVVFVFLVLAAQYESWSIAAVDHSHRADVPVGGDRGHLARQAEQRHLHADRPGRADRPGGQERDSDRRVRQATAGPGQGPRSKRRSKPAGCGCGRS